MPGGPAQIIARLRNGAPFAVEREFGAGRVVAMLSTAAPQWNNWGRNPSFVVAVLEMQAHLDRRGATASASRSPELSNIAPLAWAAATGHASNSSNCANHAGACFNPSRVSAGS